MRKDKGLNGDLDRLPMLTWIMFLKFPDDTEQIRQEEAKMARERVESRFIWHMLRSRTVFEKAWSSTTGSAQPTIPLRAIRELSVPVPPHAEQLRIVDELDALTAQVDALKKLQAETTAELKALLPSALDKAF